MSVNIPDGTDPTTDGYPDGTPTQDKKPPIIPVEPQERGY